LLIDKVVFELVLTFFFIYISIYKQGRCLVWKKRVELYFSSPACLRDMHRDKSIFFLRTVRWKGHGEVWRS